MLQALRAILIALFSAIAPFLFAGAVFLIVGAALAADIKPYVNDDLASDAVRLAETLKAEAARAARTAGKSPEDLRKAAAASIAAGKFDVAARLAAAAVTAAPKEPSNWGTYAWVAVKADDAKADNRWDLVTQGAASAYAAYERANGPEAQAAGPRDARLPARAPSAWRIALDAYKASLDRRDDLDVRKTYEDMREQYGFRILDYKVDNEAANPRVCFNFSEQLARKTDFAPMLRSPARPTRRSPTRINSLRRGPQARRALRHRAAPGAALRRSARTC